LTGGDGDERLMISKGRDTLTAPSDSGIYTRYMVMSRQVNVKSFPTAEPTAVELVVLPY
jgi:hypothetical protein